MAQKGGESRTTRDPAAFVLMGHSDCFERSTKRDLPYKEKVNVYEY